MSSILPAEAQSAESDLPTGASASPIEQFVFVGLVLVVAALVGLLIIRRARAAASSASQIIKSASRLTASELGEAQARYEHNDSDEGRYTQVFMFDRLARNVSTYRAAYELMVRGLRVKLYAEPPNPEPTLGKKMRKMDLEKAISHTTADIAASLLTIRSIGDYSRHVSFNRREHLALVVHERDLEDAYAILADQGLTRVGVVQPPAPDVTWQDS